MDDLIDTCRNFYRSPLRPLKKQGAQKVYGAITHPVFSRDRLLNEFRIQLSKNFMSLTLFISMLKVKQIKIEVITASGKFAEAIRRTSNNESISSLFEIDKG